jgi:hypothetical protein
VFRALDLVEGAGAPSPRRLDPRSGTSFAGRVCAVAVSCFWKVPIRGLDRWGEGAPAPWTWRHTFDRLRSCGMRDPALLRPNSGIGHASLRRCQGR